MGYFSCDAESAIATCDPYNWDYYRTINKTKTKKKKNTQNDAAAKLTNIRRFAYSDLVKATNCFSAETFLGKGSHGAVYKASLDDGALTAAVKKSNASSASENELEILSRVPPHPYLVNLIGFSSIPELTKTKLVLVVEYMPNGSLHDHLHCSPNPPGWSRRVRFALQVARAVHSLHSSNPPIIHRDIKSSNVLIDKDNNARLGDFGLALRGHVEDVRVSSTPPAGTLGYLDPGYLAPGDLSAKSDVFSFGILLLEIISGRKAIDVDFSPPSVVDWAVPLIKRGQFEYFWDSRVGDPGEGGKELAGLAVRCVRSSAERRPGMVEVVEVLRGISKRVRHARCVWGRLRKGIVRVGRVEKAQGDDAGGEMVRVGSSRNSSKVSNVPGLESGGGGGSWEGGGKRELAVRRSRSIGAVREDALIKGKRRLSKSRSTGDRVVCRGQVLELERGGRRKEGGDHGEQRLMVVGLDDEREKKMGEKPSVST